MKKIVLFVTLAVLSLALVACGTTTLSSNTTTTTSAIGTTVSHTPVTITYAAWNMGTIDSVNLERLMIDAFMEEYSWITVNIVERPKIPDSTGTTEIDQNWNEFLGARASQGTLPDVYFTDSTETTIMNNWTKDVTEIAHADPEFMNISADIRDAASYGGKLMALPYAVYYFGYYINKTIFENANADAPTFEDTFATFLTKVGDVANQTVTNGTGTAGIVGIDRMLEWYPAQLNEDLGWYTYDGALLHLDSPEFETTLNLYKTLMQDKSLIYDALSPEEQLAAFGTTNAWASSQLAAYWEYTPIIGSMLDYDFDIDFIGTPGTDDSHQIPVILDLMCISSQTQHLEEAYLLAKWMSFGESGYLKRIEISATVEGVNALNMTPLQPDTNMLDAFFALYPSFIEFRKVVEYDSYIIEPNKYVPGYIKARWNEVYDAETTVGQLFDKVRGGTVNYADVKTSWNTISNSALSVARDAIFTKLGVNND